MREREDCRIICNYRTMLSVVGTRSLSGFGEHHIAAWLSNHFSFSTVLINSLDRALSPSQMLNGVRQASPSATGLS
jgi:hypothetical protein